MEDKGNDKLLKSGKTTEWRLNIGGYITVCFGVFLLLGCIVAYFLNMVRGNVDAVLPLISDAAGSPPQNGLFGFLVTLGGMFGAVFMIQRYLIVAEKNSQLSGMVTIVNKCSILVGIISMLGITLVSGYPMNFQRNRDTWFMNVGLPHMIGGVVFFGLGLVYIALQTILTLFLKSKNEKSLSVRVLLLLACTAAFVYYMITVPEHLGSLSHLYYLNDTMGGSNSTGTLLLPSTMGTNLQIPIDTSGSYTNAAISEWVFVIFFCFFFFTFFKEAQEYSIVVVIETHAPGDEKNEKTDEREREFKVESKPPETKKVLRRDSTCQTMPDFFEGSVKKPQDKSERIITQKSVNKETKETLSEVDEKLQRILNASEADSTPAHCNGGSEKTVVENGKEDTAQARSNDSSCPLSIQ